jgi:fructokinase
MADPTTPTPGGIAVIGEALIDLVPTDRDGVFEAAPGGSPANVAVGLARLDVPARLAARIADDLFGRRLRAHLASNDVDLSFAVRAREPTSLAVVSVSAEGGPEYDFRVTGTADWQWTDAELAAVPDERVVALHTGSLAAYVLPGAEAIQRLVERARSTATISYDPNCRPLLMDSPALAGARVSRLLGVADVVKASAEDLAWLLPGRSPAEVAAAWLAEGPAVVAVTLGADGVVAVTRETGAVWRPGRNVDVVDTVGAGDAFVSALLAALYSRDLLGAGRREQLRGIGLDVLTGILDEAVLASAITCTRRGANPPTRAELLAGLPQPAPSASPAAA